MTTIQFKLGPWSDMADLFAWDSSSGEELTDWIAHGLNQTMQRDGLLGAWADVYESAGDTLSAKMSAEFGEVKRYAKIVPAFIAAARIGFAAYQAHRSTIEKGKLFFWLPTGLTMLKTRSVQLLHYPPYEARTFSDYLYSPTNRRWEALLGSNGYDIEHVTPLERICDVVPLAGPGSDATVINEVEPYFMPYGRAMLAVLLDQSRDRTQPVVAYGGPAHGWLKSAFPKQIRRMPTLFSLLELRVGTGKAVTPVLCANHPSEFLFFSEPGHDAKWAFDIMMQDLIAARWQAERAENRDADPAKVLRESKEFWYRTPDEVRAIVAAQEEVYGFATQSPAVRNPTSGKIATGPSAASVVTTLPRKPSMTTSRQLPARRSR